MRPPHTVIYTHGGGRLGNQIVRFAHWISWARAHEGQVEVLDMAFWPYARYFAGWREHPGCVYPMRASRADRYARWYSALPEWIRQKGQSRDRLARMIYASRRGQPGWQEVTLDIGKGESIELGDPEFFQRIARVPMTLCSGWKIADWPRFAREQAELRKFFAPAPKYAARSDAFMAALRAKHDFVAGLVIRQSDYRAWMDGRFYFSTEQYVAWIRQLLDLHPGRRAAVVVASEERQDPALFAGLPCYFASGAGGQGGHWFESFAELAQCDLVLSPPSTFGASAAFVGGIPLWPLSAIDQNLAVSQILEDGMAGAARHPVFSHAVK